VGSGANGLAAESGGGIDRSEAVWEDDSEVVA